MTDVELVKKAEDNAEEQSFRDGVGKRTGYIDKKSKPFLNLVKGFLAGHKTGTLNGLDLATKACGLRCGCDRAILTMRDIEVEKDEPADTD